MGLPRNHDTAGATLGASGRLLTRSHLEDDCIEHRAKTLHDVGRHEARHALLDTLLRVHLAHGGNDQLLLTQCRLLLDCLFVRLS